MTEEEPVKMMNTQQGHERREAGEERSEGRISDSIKLCLMLSDINCIYFL